MKSSGRNPSQARIVRLSRFACVARERNMRLEREFSRDDKLRMMGDEHGEIGVSGWQRIR